MKTLTRHAETAKAIKALLKKEFPNIRFSVTSKRYSGGNNVDVRWNLGPTTETVDALIGKFQEGSFDGMIDLYEYTNSRTDIPQAKYVFAKRDYQSEMEIQNYKLPIGKSRNLWKENLSLYHTIAKEICALCGLEFVFLSDYVPAPYNVCFKQISWQGLVQRLLTQTTFATDRYEDGHKVDFWLNEDGERITNKFRIVKI